ncbi:hypothetical protein C8R42DRAFT_728489 [Lentinula raphanica]|nr:hypothetical protein C8R42DRAFT_728489 [Lentinula raphanica]
MDYYPYGNYLYPLHPPPPPYYTQGQWQNPGRFEDIAPSQDIHHAHISDDAITTGNGTNNSPKIAFHDTAHTEMTGMTLITRGITGPDRQVVMNQCPNGSTTVIGTETAAGTTNEEVETTRGTSTEGLHHPNAHRIDHTPNARKAGTAETTGRSIASSIHAPGRSTTITVTPMAISAHSGEGQDNFEDALYATSTTCSSSKPFTNTSIIENRTWTLSPERSMEHIIAERRRRIIQTAYDQPKAREDDHWRFARNGITQRSSASGTRNFSMDQMVQGISSITI